MGGILALVLAIGIVGGARKLCALIRLSEHKKRP